jgi:uncharacterized membrane protein YdbT with pleckstrin-like domain
VGTSSRLGCSCLDIINRCPRLSVDSVFTCGLLLLVVSSALLSHVALDDTIMVCEAAQLPAGSLLVVIIIIIIIIFIIIIIIISRYYNCYYSV